MKHKDTVDNIRRALSWARSSTQLRVNGTIMVLLLADNPAFDWKFMSRDVVLDAKLSYPGWRWE